ncbi:CRISP/Allergen/PR-1-like [Parasteatoda tepidariorum]|uniref:CRISP/Allergen/PR-1-like n=1 Tax=Parasteatoda tepidariorum TaxID=114398 RepID=UPI00077F97F1|nr:CRISP/Allergen/PR-1-like [Parasteatoda tepidariorum]
MKSIYIVVVLLFYQNVVLAQEQCPAIYRRFHKQHVGCLPRKSTCRFVKIGIADTYRTSQEILKIINEYRSKVAMGEEKGAGGMPPAADMIEVTWDEELAYLAQKWTEQCHYNHECWECRLSRSYVVSQVLAEIPYYCVGITKKTDECHVEKENWSQAIAEFYDEISVFNKKLIKSMEFSRDWGHFVGINWAEVFRVGCGYVIWRVPKSYLANHYYACDIAPAPNMRGGRMYIEGPTCSQCPINSCCGGATCKSGQGYRGLCHLYNFPPLYLPPKQPFRFRCAFMRGDPSCHYSSRDSQKWEYVQTIGGNFLAIVLSSGESASVRFYSWIQIRRVSCLLINYHKGPNVHGEPGDSTLEAILEINGKMERLPLNTRNHWEYNLASYHLMYDGYAMLELKFSVIPGSYPQYLEIKEIKITAQPCGAPECVCQK